MTYFADITISGMNWRATKPAKPVAGDCYVDTAGHDGYMCDGTSWVQFAGSGPSQPMKLLEPTREELEKYPTLKQAWDEYMVIRKLLGL